jgi:peptidoglycan hydrolase CwlO-like protein
LSEENQRLREENERLRGESKRLAGQVQYLSGQCSKQKTAIDALKRELEKGLQCYADAGRSFAIRLINWTQVKVQITTPDALIDELKKNKSELEKTPEDNE